MNHQIKEKIKNHGMATPFLILILAILANESYQYYSIIKNTKALSEQNSNLTQKITDVETVLLATQDENTTFKEALEQAKEKAEELAKDFNRVNRNVNELEKIAQTDPELLQKYSKVFFLNEHYVPKSLKSITSKWTFDQNRDYKIHADVWPSLKELLEDAEDEDLELLIVSAFRSFDTQAQLKGAYTVQYGSGANTFSADQGYSEHQLGTAVDFTTKTLGANFEKFAQTPEYAWLKKYAHNYGFTLSYPENNSYYQFEPWHWRFVGERLAEDLYDDGKFFYDLEQREIDKYIADLF